MPVSNLKIRGRHVIGLKFDSRFPFLISVAQSKVFQVTIHLDKLFSWRHLSNGSAFLGYKFPKFLIQYPCIQSDLGLFQLRIFLPASLLFIISICIPSFTVGSSNSFSTFLNQSVFSMCITSWSHKSLQKCLPSSASGITFSVCVFSILLDNLFCCV